MRKIFVVGIIISLIGLYYMSKNHEIELKLDPNIKFNKLINVHETNRRTMEIYMRNRYRY